MLSKWNLFSEWNEHGWTWSLAKIDCSIQELGGVDLTHFSQPLVYNLFRNLFLMLDLLCPLFFIFKKKAFTVFTHYIILNTHLLKLEFQQNCLWLIIKINKTKTFYKHFCCLFMWSPNLLRTSFYIRSVPRSSYLWHFNHY